MSTRHPEQLRYEEATGGVRAVGALLLAAGAISWLTGLLPADPPHIRWAVPAALCAFGAVALFLFGGYKLKFDPRLRVLDIEHPGLFGRSSQRVAAATVVRIEYVHHDSVEHDLGEHGSGSWQVRLRLRDGRKIALTHATSWGREEKRGLGERLAHTLGVPFQSL